MAPQENTSHILETVEEGKDAIPDDTAIQRAGMEGTRTSQLPERTMESGTHAELHPDKQRNSPARIYYLVELL